MNSFLNSSAKTTEFCALALGNALLDHEYAVDEALLQQLDIEKGVMTLIDAERYHALNAQLLKMQLHCRRASGGSAANSMIAIAQLNGKSALACSVADDATGQFYLKDLRDSGVTPLSQPKTHPSLVTGTCLVFITPDAERTMLTYLGIADQWSINDIQSEHIANTQWLYIEGYSATSAAARALAFNSRGSVQAQGKRVAMSFSDLSMVKYFRNGLEEMIANTPLDLLFCNHHEAFEWTQTSDMSICMEKLSSIAKEVVITQGSKGCTGFSAEGSFQAAGYPTKAIDTNGAGDLFAGCYLFAREQGFAAVKAADFANLAAAELVKHYGPRLRKNQLQDIWQSWVK
ncbi:MAG: adenosine kinase [Pseudomonadota bacterium]